MLTTSNSIKSILDHMVYNTLQVTRLVHLLVRVMAHIKLYIEHRHQRDHVVANVGVKGHKFSCMCLISMICAPLS